MYKNKEGSYIKILPHIVIWALVLIVPLYIMLKGERTYLRDYVSFGFKTTVLAIVFYVNYLYLIERYLFKKKILLYLSINLLMILVLISCQTLLIDIIAPSRRKFSPPRTAYLMRMFFDYVFVFLMLGMSVAMKVTTQWYKDSINLEKARRTQLEADLLNLRTQLNPHFLFNTLNNIYSLIAIDSVKAQDAVHRLSGLLRYVLYENEDNFVDIDKELEFTKAYIDLMALRYGAKLKLIVNVANNIKDGKIATLLFITLIENAFKHGIVKNKQSYIKIDIWEKSDKIFSSIENSIDRDNYKNMEDKTSGIGLSNLTKRLNLLYLDKHNLEIIETPESFIVNLNVTILY